MSDRLHTIEAGARSLPTVVLLHGFGGNAGVWADLIGQLKSHAHMLAFDLPGHGGSLTYPNFGSPRVAALAVAQEMKLRGIEQFHLVGHSMGGAVASLIALSDAASVASLTLLAPGGFGSQINIEIMQALAMAASIDDLRACFKTMMRQGADVSETGLRRDAAMRAADGQMDALALIFSKITRDGAQGKLPLDELARLPISVRILWGEQDNVVPVGQLADAPDSFIKTTLPNAGHMLIEEAPEAVIEAILAQLQ